MKQTLRHMMAGGHLFIGGDPVTIGNHSMWSVSMCWSSEAASAQAKGWSMEECVCGGGETPLHLLWGGLPGSQHTEDTHTHTHIYAHTHPEDAKCSRLCLDDL